MSNAIKWALLTAGAVLLIGMVLSLSFIDVIDISNFNSAVSTICNYTFSAFRNARGIVNNFFSSWGRSVLTGVIWYEITKFAVTLGIRITTWIYHFIFRG